MKKHTSHFLLACGMFLASLHSTVAQTPANDLCSNATALQSGTTTSGSSTGATPDNAPFCASVGNTSPGVWYSITGNGGLLTLSTCNQAGFDTKITLYSGSCGNLVCEAANDDGPGCANFSSELNFLTTIGVPYLVLVHGFGAATGNFDLTTNLGPPQAPNDSCAGALPIACGQTVLGTTLPAQPDTVPACVTSITSKGVWYTVQGTGNALTATLCSGTNFDSKLTVFSGSCGALTCLTANDDFCGQQSEVTWSTLPNQTYYLLVHGFGSAAGNYQLSLDCGPPPANDQPCNALPLPFGSLTFDNTLAGTDSAEISPGIGSGAASCNATDGWCFFDGAVQNSVWYTFVAPPGGSVDLLTDGFDSQLAVYTTTDCGDYSQYVEVAANDDGASQLDPSAFFLAAGLRLNCLEPGQVYYVQVDGLLGASSISGSISLTDNNATLPSVDLGECQSSFAGYLPVAGDTNFLYAGAQGQGPFLFSWNILAGDSTVLFSDQPVDSLGILAVQPLLSSLYEVILLDGNGCAARDTIAVEKVDLSCFGGVQLCYDPDSSGQAIVLDWETDLQGNPLPAGTPVTNQYAGAGITISATNGGNGPHAAAIFDSSNPTGGDTDLGTPHTDFGGPGVGAGGAAGSPGQNDQSHGNLLIIQERPQMCGGVFCTPDDEAGGGCIHFQFDDPLTVETVVIVDADDGNPSGAVVTLDANGGTYSLSFPSLGNNSVMTLPIFEDGVRSMQITFNGSGAVGTVRLRRETVTFCSPSGDVASYLADPAYHLGTCGDTCQASNPGVPPPPACDTLVVQVTTDDFASETSWELVDQSNGMVLGSRQFGFQDDFQTFSDTFCVDPRRCYEVTISDAFGDGICCTAGQGNWSVVFDGTTVASPSGGAFGSSETLLVGNCGANKEENLSLIPEEKSKGLVLFPNPSSGEVHLRYFSEQKGATWQLEIYDLQGRRQGQIHCGSTLGLGMEEVEVQLGGIADGLYLYRFVAGDQAHSGKIQLLRP